MGRVRIFAFFAVFCGCAVELERGEGLAGDEPIECAPFGFSCAGDDEHESARLALECEAIGGYCAGWDEPIPAACEPPATRAPHCYPL